jgi:hypothetical protein
MWQAASVAPASQFGQPIEIAQFIEIGKMNEAGFRKRLIHYAHRMDRI